MTRGVVVHREYGPAVGGGTAPFDPRRWPDGQDYLDVLRAEGVLLADEEPRGGGSDREQSGSSSSPEYWQAAARWALLSKYGALVGGTDSEKEEDGSASALLRQISYADAEVAVEKGGEGSSGSRRGRGRRRHLALTGEAIGAISRRWGEVVEEAATSSSEPRIHADLLDFLRTGRSNGRAMRWTVLECPGGLQFPVHSHPNLELVYDLRGDLHEVRMCGDPVPAEARSDGAVVSGPDLTGLRRPWRFGTVREGEWLVNEVGSVHKTFTSSRSDGGCLLLVGWGGSNANVDPAHEPVAPNVQEAVDAMDARLCGCGSPGRWEEIRETFLPESERSAAASHAP